VQKMPMTKSPNATFGNAYSAPLHNLYDVHENSIPFLHCDLAVVYFTSLSLLNRETCQTFGYLLIARVIPTSPCLPKRLHYGGRVSHGSAPHGHAFHGHVPHRRVLRERAPHRRASYRHASLTGMRLVGVHMHPRGGVCDFDFP